MKHFISSLLIGAGLWLPWTQLCCGQASAAPAPAPSNQPKIAPRASTSVESERAEDALLLQQMESDSLPARAEGRAKGENGTAQAHRDRGWAGAGVMAQGGFQNRMNVVTRPGAASQRALVVRSSAPDPQAEAGLEEDLAVMSHLLNKALEDLPGGPPAGNKVMGIDVLFTSGSSPLRSLYLDNYGAVFFLSVNFPVVPPSEKHAEEKPAGDSAWEEARQELYGQRFERGLGEQAEEYSQEKVDKLKDTLFEAIKNASNIRGLKLEDYVTVWVCGGTGSRAGRVRAFKANPPGALGGNIIAAEQPTAAKRTILTLRARKSDIDDYAKGNMPAEQFHKRAQLTTYTGDAAAGTSEAFAFGRPF